MKSDFVYEFLDGWFSYANHANTYNLKRKIAKKVENNFQGNISLLEINRMIKREKVIA